MTRKPKPTKTKRRTAEPTAQPLQHELRQHLTEHATHLRSLAAMARERGEPPVLEEYVRTGRGPAYQRAEVEWLKTYAAIVAFEEAASRLEEALAYAPR